MDESQVTNRQSVLKNIAEEQRPLLHVYLFGSFQLHWHVPSLTSESAWDSRTSARSLFKLLLCASERQAAKSVLAGILWPETDEEKALESLRSAVKVLRKVLCTANGEELIEQRGNNGMLKLAEQNRLWVDTDAFEEYVAQASRATTADEALPLWQQARTLLRGEFLAEDQQYEWASYRWVKQRRQTLWMARSRMIRHLADLYIQRGDLALAEEELEQHIARFPTDQDALYRLLTLLEQQECFELASILYSRTKHILDASGKQPAKQVRAVYERIQRAIASLHQAPLARSGDVVQQQKAAENQATSLSLTRNHNRSDIQPHSSTMNGPSETLFPLLQTLSERAERPEMAHIARRQLLELGIASCITRLAQLDSKHISAVEREELGRALGQSIADGWKLFHTAPNAEVLATGQFQLSLLHQAHALIHPSALPYFYAGIYGLIGIALHFQRRDEEALRAYHHGYIAARAINDPWYIAQSLICQSDSYYALGQYNMAIQVIEEALKTISVTTDEAIVRTKAHLLTCWADNAAMLQENKIAQEKLDAAEVLLDPNIFNEEFDYAAWLVIAGKIATSTGKFTVAKDYYEKAFVNLPEQWLLRRTMTAIGLAHAYANIEEREQTLSLAKDLAVRVQTNNAELITTWFTQYLQQGLLKVFSTDKEIESFVAETVQQLTQHTRTVNNSIQL